MVAIQHDISERLKEIKLLATDVDGVLTDGGMYYSEHGDELKKFNTRDGMGIQLLRRAGIKVVFITSENSCLVRRRADKLEIDALYQGVTDKAAVIRELAAKHGISTQEIAYIGDDINDLSALKVAGLGFTVADGLAENKKIANYVTQAVGGGGAIREIATLILANRVPSRSKAAIDPQQETSV